MTKPSPALDKAKAFLLKASEFQLGELPTEQPHPKTSRLAEMAQEDCAAAIETLRTVEIDAVHSGLRHRHEVEGMTRTIRDVLSQGGRIFLCGCGATGRLSLSLETIWRKEFKRSAHPEHHADQVISFMAGGDYALVRSIENFEDHPEYGARQLREAGFAAGDLLIACTEGGETPFVIGATEEAASISKYAPYFLFCNPVDILKARVERSRRVLENPAIRSICFDTGPMALAGSTRLQASTILMLAAGAALFENLTSTPSRKIIEDFIEVLRLAPFDALAPLIIRESEIYASGQACLHRCSEHAITVLTDTTERSPTFSLVPFENALESAPPLSWTYLHIDGARDSGDAWRTILEREPRPLSWPQLAGRFDRRVVLGFDFSQACEARRAKALQPARQYVYSVRSDGPHLVLELGPERAVFSRPTSLLAEHLLLKCALNISSTLVMGRIGRFRRNLMLYVKSSNNKLVDRSIRYVQTLLAEDGLTQFSYEDVAHALFEVLEELLPGEPAVPRTYEYLRASQTESKTKIR